MLRKETTLTTSALLAACRDLRAKLPEAWRDVELREEYLRMDPVNGTGLALEHCEFVLWVTGVVPRMGRRVRPGDVVVAVNGQPLVGLSAPQMRFLAGAQVADGLHLAVASLSDVHSFAARELLAPECQHAPCSQQWGLALDGHLKCCAAEASPAVRSSAQPPGPWLTKALSGHRVCELVPFPRPLSIGAGEFTHFVVEREFRTASQAQLLRLLPGDAYYISKFEDIRHEYAVMCALCRMNLRWKEKGVTVCGMPVELVTYYIAPLGSEAGLVEVVSESSTLRELASGCNYYDRHLRVLRALHGEQQRLDRLAATTVAYLTAGYALGVRDGHDDNIMLRADGALFRIDFGFIFGETPEIDTPQTIVPYAVRYALGESRWKAVVVACRQAMEALSAVNEPPAWDCLRRVPQLAPLLDLAFDYSSSLSMEAFFSDVKCADQWSFSRAAKNTLREVMRMWSVDWDSESDLDFFASSFGHAAASMGCARDEPLPLDDPFAATPPGSPSLEPHSVQIQLQARNLCLPATRLHGLRLELQGVPQLLLRRHSMMAMTRLMSGLGQRYP